MLAVKVRISTTSHDNGIGIIHYVHSLIGLKDIHVSKRDVDNQFQDIFNSNQSLTLEGDDLNHLRNEACYLMGKIHQKYLLLQVNDDHIQDFIDPFELESDQFDDNASNGSSQIMSDDSSHNDNDSSWVPEDNDCSVTIDDDEQSNHHYHLGKKVQIMVRTIFLYKQHQTSI